MYYILIYAEKHKILNKINKNPICNIRKKKKSLIIIDCF